MKEEPNSKIIEFCHKIGCSGLDRKCPGNPNCGIVRKIFPARYLNETLAILDARGREMVEVEE